MQSALDGAGNRFVIFVSHQPLRQSVGGDTSSHARLLAKRRPDPRRATLTTTASTRAETPHGGYWNIETASLIDYPQQSRALRFHETDDGGIAIETWMLDHVPGNRVAQISRELSFLQATGGRPGTSQAREPTAMPCSSGARRRRHPAKTARGPALRGDRNAEAHARANWRRRQPDVTTVRVDDRSRDRKSQSGAVGGSRRVGTAAVEGFEHELTLRRGDTVAAVLDLHFNRVTERFGPDDHGAVRRRVAYRVLDQVEEHPLKLLRVASCRSQLVREIRPHGDPAHVGLSSHGVHGL